MKDRKTIIPGFLLIATFALFYACNRTPFPPASDANTDIEQTIESLSLQLEENVKAENPEAYIRNYIDLLEVVQQLLPGTEAWREAYWNVIHYANKFGLYHQGIELTEEVLAESAKDTGTAGYIWKERLHSAMAGFYFELHEYDKALQAYHQTMYYMDLIYGAQEHISMMNNIGMAFHRAGRVDSALYYLRRVDSIVRAPKAVPLMDDFMKDDLFGGSVKDNLATLLEEQGFVNDALELYRENFSMYGKYGLHPQRHAKAGLRLARMQLQSGKYGELKHTIGELDHLFRTLSYPGKREQELDYYHILAQYYIRLGSPSVAGEFQQAYVDLADSLYTAQLENTRLISNEFIAYKARHFSEQIAHEKKEVMLSRQKARSRLWMLAILVISSILGGLLLSISYRQRLRLARKQAELKEVERQLAAAHAKAMEQEKAILDVALQHKKKDISNLALDAMIKKEWAEKLDGLLSNAEQSRGHMRSMALRKLREEIRSHIHADQRINQFQQHIETLSNEFYDHLNALNADLSKTEVRLISFLKMRLSNDEIAMLQGISLKSVIMSRYRLRKKLGLPEGADLDTFCQEL